MKVRVVVELAGHPKEHIEDVTKKILEKIKQEYKVTEEQVAELKEIKELWSTFIEAVVEFKDIEEMGMFCFDYMPSSVQIEEPENISMTNNQLSNIFNDIMAKLHVYDATTKTFNARNKVLEIKLKKAISALRKEMDEIGAVQDDDGDTSGKKDVSGVQKRENNDLVKNGGDGDVVKKDAEENKKSDDV
ncbi:MAG: hypothetical protein KKG60_03670 [Nanoarchaeota archaeon]|nr:hypothetical protein [Nanoarchaeota archaeon]